MWHARYVDGGLRASGFWGWAVPWGSLPMHRARPRPPQDQLSVLQTSGPSLKNPDLVFKFMERFDLGAVSRGNPLQVLVAGLCAARARSRAVRSCGLGLAVREGAFRRLGPVGVVVGRCPAGATGGPVQSGRLFGGVVHVEQPGHREAGRRMWILDLEATCGAEVHDSGGRVFWGSIEPPKTGGERFGKRAPLTGPLIS